MKVKRIVTGRNDAGESVFVSVGDAPNTHDFQHNPGMAVTQVWSTPPAPVLDGAVKDPTAVVASLVPRPGGTQLLIVAFPPDRGMMSPSFNAAAFGEEHLRHSPGLAETFEPDSPGMHTTDTIDYGIVLRGEVWLELDGARVEHLRTGDVAVQNGTRHAWRNRSDEVAVVAFVLIGAARKR